METLTVTIIEPKAEKLLEDMESMNLIRLERDDTSVRRDRSRIFGSMPGLVEYIADDFDAPLEDFEDYM